MKGKRKQTMQKLPLKKKKKKAMCEIREQNPPISSLLNYLSEF